MINVKWIAAALLGVSVATAYGQYVGPSELSVTTVRSARQVADDTPVVLEGRIIRRLKGEKYEFQDGTGKMTVEIDADKWPSKVSEHDQVRLFGEVDRDVFGTEIDVDRVEVIQKEASNKPVSR